MKLRIMTTGVLLVSLPLCGCVGLQDDAFAHAMKSGSARMAVATMEPGQARLQIQEVDGHWYYPIHYSIVRGDPASTFDLLRKGSPTRLDGRSLAYNAARVNQTELARELAGAGYGTHSDISEALAANRRDQQIGRQNAAIASMAIVGLFALMANSNQGSSRGELEKQFQEYEAQKTRDEYLANQHGL